MKRDVKVFLIMVAAALVMFFVLPLVINIQPNEQVSIYGTQILYLIVNMIFMGVVGWYSVSFEKFQFLVPLPILVIFLISQIFIMGGILPILLINYAEAAYMILCLRKVLNRYQEKSEKKRKPKPFPKSIKKK